MIKRFSAFTLVCLFFTAFALAQTAVIKGKLTDENKTPLSEVKIFLTRTTDSVITLSDGSFTFSNIPYGNYSIERTNARYDFIPVTFVADKPEVNLGEIAFERKSPAMADESIPVVTLTEDDLKETSQGVASVLNASRDAFQSAATYSFSVARFNIRGYDDDNFLTLMNGAPMTDLTSDRTLYNTWGGLNDVTRSRENSFGLEPATFAYGTVGGSNTIDSRASHQRKQLQVSYALSNRAYENRLMVTYGSGMLKNGWSYAISYSRRWAQEGYVDGTFYDAHAWFASLEKIINSSHSLALTAFGAPTKYGKANGAVQEMYDLAGTNYYNPNWGYQNGEKRNAAVANNNRPVFILTHDWQMNTKSSLLTAVSFVTGKTKSSSLDWYNATDPRPDYYRNLPSYILSTTGDQALYDQAVQLYQTDENAQQIKWDDLYQYNYFGSDTSLYVVADRVISSNIINVNTVYNQLLNDHVTLSSGAAFQNQSSEYYKELTDLMGGQYFVNLNQFADEDIAGNEQYDLNNPNRKIYEGDQYDYSYLLHITKVNAWGQLQFKHDKVDYFVAMQLSSTSFYRTGNYRNGVFADNSYGDSDKESFFNTSFKGGLTYKINGRNYLFVNALAESRPPLVENTFISPATQNTVIEDIESSKVVSVEGGYHLRAPRFKARAVAYYTQFNDATDIKRFYHDDFRTFVNYSITGIDTRHVGVELSADATLGKGFSATAVAAIGQYYHTSRPYASVTQDNADTVLASNEVVYANNLHIGGSPENAYSIGINYNAKDFWQLHINANYFDNSFLSFNPARRTLPAVDQVDDPAQREAILSQEKLDGQFTLDVSGGKSWKLKNTKKNTFIILNVGINNILNNTDFVTGGFEQLRFDFVDHNPDKFASKYYYAFGTNFFASVTLRFN